MLVERINQFIRCHQGVVNKLIHIVGFIILGIGIWQTSVWLVIAGGVTQELGHVYQYLKTRDPKASPFYCLKPQLLFAYPIFAVILVYVIVKGGI